MWIRRTALAVALVLTACHPTGRPAATLPTIHVHAQREDDGTLRIDAYDAPALFERATKALQQGDLDTAAALYEKLVTEFPDAPETEAAWYNLGLCRSHRGDLRGAGTAFHAVTERYPDTRTAKDAAFQLLALYAKQHAWDAVISAAAALESRSDLDVWDRIELHARKGEALYRASRPLEAKGALETALYLYRRDPESNGVGPNYYAGMAVFYLGELLHDEMRRVQIPADGPELVTALEKKCRLLLYAQSRYTDVIRIAHPHWAAAAAYRTGALYHHLWNDLLQTPAPDTVATTEERAIFDEILRKRIKVLLEKAITQWKRTLRFANRLGLDNEWVAKTKADLAHIETVLEREKTVGQDLPVE